MMTFRVMLRLSLFFALSVELTVVPAQAAIVVSGNTDPTATSSWWTDGGDVSTDAYVGKNDEGWLNITAGGALSSGYGYIGYNDGSTGTVTVDGVGSLWTIYDDLRLGNMGAARLNIINDGTVDVAGDIFSTSSPAEIHFNNGTLITGGLYVDESQLTGTGTIYAEGVSVDEDLLFDAVSGSANTLTLDDLPEQNITMHLTPSAQGHLYVGCVGEGSLTIRDGIEIASNYSFLGREVGSTGTAVVDGAGSNWNLAGALSVGGKGVGSLNITNGGTVSSGWARIGANPGSVGTATVDGVDSIWNAGRTSVGYSGNGTLNITGGGSVSSGVAYIGDSYGATGVATVDGTDSTWIVDSELHIGYSNTNSYPSHGILNVLNGATVSSNSAWLGCYSGSTGTATIDGTGSNWSVASDLCIGRNNIGTLNITNGASVSNSNAYLGYYSTASGSATLDGIGSSWTVSNDLFIGNYGNGTLNITGGGTLDVKGNAYVAAEDGSIGTLNIASDGTVNVSGDTHVGVEDGSTGEIHFDNGTLNTTFLRADISQLTGTGTISAVNLPSGAGDVDMLFDAAGGTTSTFTINSLPEQNITMHLTPSAQEDLTVGYFGNGSLMIRDGIEVSSNQGYLGYESGSTGTASIDGIGSEWDINSGLYIGRYGNGTLNITNDGTVYSSIGFLGLYSGSTGTAMISGADSSWITGYIHVGNYGMGVLDISSGGAVFSSGQVRLGRNPSSTGIATVDGEGSTWALSGDMFVGNYGNGTLNITNGGAVSSSNGYVGRLSGSAGIATVDGAGSTWALSGDMFVGNYGNGTLNIIGGGIVDVEGDTYVASENGSTGEIHFDNGTLNTTFLRADISQLTGTGTISAVNLPSGAGDVDMLFDAAGGTTSTFTINSLPEQNITMHFTPSSDGDLTIGYSSNGTMTIRDGISIASTYGYLGYESGSNGTATVTGVASNWNMDYNLYVGNYGNGTLNITGGGTVSSCGGLIGRYLGSNGTVTVDGADSAWNVTYGMTVGYLGAGTINITDGGTVSSRTVNLGYSDGSNGTATVDGSDSTWTIGCDLYVGSFGTGMLNVTGGGVIDVGGDTYVGV